jgi:uncharacterized membrane protein
VSNPETGQTRNNQPLTMQESVMALAELAVAASAFIGTHFVLSHPLRAPLVRRLGEGGFLLVYSLIALASFGWLIRCFGQTPADMPAWDGHAPLVWALASLLTVVATGLFLASFNRNPALAGAKATGLAAATPKGVFRITRHPMMFGIAIWAVAHILIAPTPRGLVLMGTIVLVAVVGSHLQDRKKQALDAENFVPWVRRTPFWPDVRHLGQIGFGIWGLALGVWLVATWLHMPLAGEPAGAWILNPGLLP